MGAPTVLSDGQRQAIASLRSIAKSSGGDLLIDASSQRMIRSWVELRVWISSAGIQASENGIPLAEREPIDILIPEDFPFQPPRANAGHTRFAGLPHVQWGDALCLYASPSEWDPAAGMAGFLRRLLAFYKHIAMGTLGGPQAPWHPPVAYTDDDAGCVVIRADLVPADRVRSGSFMRWALGVQLGADRADILDWLGLSPTERTTKNLVSRLTSELREARTRTGYDDAFLIPAVILPEPIGWEYPESVRDLLAAIDGVGIQPHHVLTQLCLTMLVNDELRFAAGAAEPDGAYLVVRAPADKRFTTADPPAHFAAWRLRAEDEVALLAGDEADQRLERLRTWLDAAEISWAWVYDTRPEAVLRRDAGRPVEKVRGSRILILGCGALGAPVAEHCVRAGAGMVHVIDYGEVKPGILVRQPYDDADIGLPKARVLERKLRDIRPDADVWGAVADVVSCPLLTKPVLTSYDLIIDATADRSVAAWIERLWRDRPHRWPDLVTVAISQTARYGVAAVTPRGSTGAGIDLFRRLALFSNEDPTLTDVYREFFPSPGERIEFEPERGCSGTTFVGSNTDVTALAAQLLDSALANTGPIPVRVSETGEAEYTPRERTLSIVRLGSDDESMTARTRRALPHDRVGVSHDGIYEVRIDQRAMAEMRRALSETRSTDALADHETGGLLLGQFDDACGVVWVSEAIGPPAGSLASPHFMVINTPAARDHVGERNRQTSGLTSFVGLWHTHPGGPAAPSEMDAEAMRKLLAEAPGHSPRILLVILSLPGSGASPAGRLPDDWDPGIYAEVLSGLLPAPAGR